MNRYFDYDMQCISSGAHHSMPKHIAASMLRHDKWRVSMSSAAAAHSGTGVHCTANAYSFENMLLLEYMLQKPASGRLSCADKADGSCTEVSMRQHKRLGAAAEPG